jgi:hypothetical protein
MPITTTPSGGPQGEFSTYTPIYAQTLSATTASVTFSNIPTTFTDLVLVINVKNPGAGAGNSQLRFNGDSSAVYSQTNLIGDGTNATSSRASTQTVLKLGVVGNTNQAFTQNIFQIMNYTNPTTFKTVLSRQTWQESVAARVGLWRNTSPITQITLSVDADNTNFSSGSSFTLYGIKAAATQFIPSKASGGDIVATDGTYAYHAFTTTGTFRPLQSLSCDVLVVAGGGAGGSGGGGNSNGGAGGGAGGFRVVTSQSVTATNYTITVGAGGAFNAGDRGSTGSNSSISGISITSSGGGGGGRNGGTLKDGFAGGSGGGGGASGGVAGAVGAGNSGSYSPVEGFAGVAGLSDGVSYDNGGAGGGASGIGSAATSARGGNGGAGSNSYSSWASATSTGVSGYYAGGGGGAGFDAKTAGTGGAGGGGAASNGNGNNATPGTFSTGGGGGGGGINGNGGSGGSGIVIVRYTL